MEVSSCLSQVRERYHCFRKCSKCWSLSHVWLFAIPWTVAHQAPPSMEFSRPEYWSGLPFPSPEDLPDPEIEPGSPALQADSLLPEPWGKTIVNSCYTFPKTCARDTRMRRRMEGRTGKQACSGKESLPGASLVALTVENLPAMWENRVQSLGWEDPLEKWMATLSSILAWEIPRTEEPGRLQFMGLQRVRHDWATNTA